MAWDQRLSTKTRKGEGMRLQERDKQILSYISRFHCLSSLHISALFGMHIKASQRRLRKLVESGYLDFVRLASVSAGKSPHLFFLSEQCAKSFDVNFKKPRVSVKLGHQNQNSQILVDIYAAFKGGNIECDIMPEHILRQRFKIIPDASFMLKRNGKQALFLMELCSGTEIIASPSYYNDIEKKLISYIGFFQDGDMKEYDELFNSSLKFNRFRLLFVANNVQRQKAISKIISKHDHDGFIWITTMPQLNQSGIRGSIWSVPGANETGKAIV